MPFHSHAQALRTTIRRRLRCHRVYSITLARVLSFVVMAGLLLSVLPGEDVVASPASASPTATPRPTSTPQRASGQVRPAAENGLFVTGTIWDDSRVRNGIFDDNEGPLDGVTVLVALERVDTPGTAVPCVGGVGTPANINPTNSAGRYRCNVPTPGTYRVTITIPSGYEATTPRQREVVVTATEGGVANFGLANLDQRIRTIAGVVFLDCNENGIRDLAVEFDNNPPNGSFTVRLERTDGSNRITARGNRYSFDNVDTGSYVVTLAISDSDIKATTSTRREVTIGSTFGAVVDFGVIGLNDNGACARAANSTATAVVATTVAQANRTATAVVRSGGQGIQPGNLPPAVATAIAANATATAARFTPTPVPTPIPTATTLPTNRLSLAYPRSARFLMQAVARYPDGRRTDMLAEGALIGLETFVFQDAGQRVGSEQLSMRIKRNEQVDDIVVTAQEAYRQRQGDEFWRIVQYSEIRNELGLLAPLDAIVALRCISRGQDGGQAVIDGAVTRYILGEVDALRFWETSIRPQYGSGGGGGAAQAPTIAGGAGRAAQGRVIPSCVPPPQTRITSAEAGVEGAQPVYQSMQVEAWVGLEDGLIRSERLTARVLPPIGDPKQMPDPIELDVVLTYSDVNKPITIIPPPVPTPTAIPPTPAPAVPSALQPSGSTAIQPAPDNGRPGLQAPAPGINGFPTPEALGTPEGIIEGGEELPQPSGATPGQREQALSADRALAANRAQEDLASAAGPRAGSRLEPDGVALAVPPRRSGSDAFTTDGAAALAMILEAFGSTVQASDLQALIERLQGAQAPGEPARLDTLVRVGERGSLRPVGGQDDWSAALAQEYLRRGFPVLALVNAAQLPGATLADQSNDRYIILVGYEGDTLLYRDPLRPEGAARRISPAELDRAWANAIPPRQGVAFAFGANLIGLFDVPARQATAEATSGRATTPSPAAATPTPARTQTPLPTQPAGGPAPADGGGGVSWLLIAFFVLLALLLGFLLARLLR